MTDFSRNSRQEVQAVPVDFRAIIAECADNLRYMERADRVALRVVVEGEDFCSDPQRINTVFQNLMSNSVKYQRLHISDAFIEFCIHCTAREARIVYTDNGKGIDTPTWTKSSTCFPGFGRLVRVGPGPLHHPASGEKAERHHPGAIRTRGRAPSLSLRCPTCGKRPPQWPPALRRLPFEKSRKT
jgi:light-regulated signal transduction histidine kinase (bacteriophytochrome)